jgi:hypothetical protein
VHTFHMVSLFGRTVIAKKMTFDPSTTLAYRSVSESEVNLGQFVGRN